MGIQVFNSTLSIEVYDCKSSISFTELKDTYRFQVDYTETTNFPVKAVSTSEDCPIGDYSLEGD